MYILQYSNEQQIQEVKARLEQLSLAFSIEQKDDIPGVQLLEGKKIVVGQQSILQHLDELSGELHQWYYCNC